MPTDLVTTAKTPDSDQLLLGSLRMLSSVINARTQFANSAGLTFNGGRDLYHAFGYKRLLLPRDYRQRYDRGGVAARIVEAPAIATWRSGAEIIEDADTQTQTPFEVAVEEFIERFDLWSVFKAFDTLAGIHHYSVLVYAAPGDMSSPLVSLQPDELVDLVLCSEEDARITAYDLNKSSRRFGQPAEYTLQRTPTSQQVLSLSGVSSNRVGSLELGKPIHWSRTQHLADNVLDDRVFGAPRLERVWNLLDDLEKVTGGGAEAFFRRADPGTVAKIDPTMKASQDSGELDKVKEQINEFIDGFRRVLTLRGVDLQTQNASVADFHSPVNSIFDQLSASTGIPQRILMGSERGELASTQDRNNWNDLISDRRTQFATPRVVRPFINRMIELGVLPKPKRYTVRWPELKNLDLQQQATVATLWATINKNFGGTVVTANEIRDKLLGLSPLETVTLADQVIAATARGDLTEVDRLLGIAPDARSARALIAAPTSQSPPIVINLTLPPATAGAKAKRIEYAQIDGQLRPVTIIEGEIE